MAIRDAVTPTRILVLDAGKSSMKTARGVVMEPPRSTRLGPGAGLWHRIPADKQIARLDALATEVIARGWAAYITTPLGRPVRLFVQDPGDTAMCSYIVAAPDEATGDWWYWFGWAERIAPAEMPVAAAEAIIRTLRRPAEPS